MPTYKLTYSDVTGHVESLKYMFHYAGINFEDIRLPKGSSFRFPVETLEIDGKKYDEMKSVGRYLAKQCMLYGADEIEAFEIDAVVDSIEDIRSAFTCEYWLMAPYVANIISKNYVSTVKLSVCLRKLEERVKENSGYFVRGKLSWADILYAAYIGSTLPASPVAKRIHKNHPELKKLMDKVHALPNIESYLDQRTKKKKKKNDQIPMYKLIYRGMTNGIVESFKYMFHYGCINFENVHLNFDEWNAYKMRENHQSDDPVLEIDGKKYDYQSYIAFGRYLAKNCNLYGSDDVEAIEIDVATESILTVIKDAMKDVHVYWENHTIIMDPSVISILPDFLKELEEQVKKNDGYFVRGKLSWADILYAACIGISYDFTETDIHENYPELKKLVDNIHALPNIKSYFDQRTKKKKKKYSNDQIPTYKLIYRDMTNGIVESFKYMFHYGCINFENVHLNDDEWNVYQTRENHQTDDPVLEINGKKYDYQSYIAFGRYLAKNCNLYGSDDVEAIEIDVATESILTVMKDAMKDVHVPWWDRTIIMDPSVVSILPDFLKELEEQVKKNNGYFIRGKLSWADILYAACIGISYYFPETDIHENYPELKKLVDNIHALPNIKAYLDERPKTLF